MSDADEQDVRPPGGSTPGGRVHSAVTRVLRWGSRADVRRQLLGDAGKDLSPTDTWLLGAIQQQGPVRASDLAGWQGVDKSTITPQVRRLEDFDLVSREVDPTDRRAVLLSLTPRGHQVQRRMGSAGASVLDQVLQGWSADDREALAVLITRFAEDLEGFRLR